MLAIFVEKVGAGKVFAANGEQARLIVDKIEKAEQRERPKANQRPIWVPQDRLLREQRQASPFDAVLSGC